MLKRSHAMAPQQRQHPFSIRSRAWKTKRIQDQLENKSNGTLPRILHLHDLTFLGIGSIVGAGVYVLSGVTSHDVAGPSVILSYFIASLAALLSALCYAEFAADLPIAGGAYNYIATTFGELAAWTVAWNMILETMLSSSAVARGFSGYLSTLFRLDPSHLLLFPVPSSTWSLDICAVLLIALLTLVLCKGLKDSSTFNIIMCSVNLACICFVLFAGLPRGNFKENLVPFFPFGIRGTFAASSIVFFAFIGFDYIANAAEEASNPGRDLPLSIVGSLIVATLLYAFMSLTIVAMMPYLDIDVHAPFSAAFASHGMHLAAAIVSCGAIAGIVTSTMTGLLSQTRLFVILGRERLLPPVLSVVHASTGTPLYATLLTGACSGALALMLDINVLAELVSVGTLYVFYAVCAGVLHRRYVGSGGGGGGGGGEYMDANSSLNAVATLPGHHMNDKINNFEINRNISGHGGENSYYYGGETKSERYTNPVPHQDFGNSSNSTSITRDVQHRHGGGLGITSKNIHSPGIATSSETSPRRVLMHIAAVTLSSIGTSVSFTLRAPLPILLLFLVFLALTTAALYSLPIAYHPSIFSVPVFPLTPALGMFFCVHLLCSLGWPAYLRFVVWMGLGLAVYIFYGAPSAERFENSAAYRMVSDQEKDDDDGTRGESGRRGEFLRRDQGIELVGSTS